MDILLSFGILVGGIFLGVIFGKLFWKLFKSKRDKKFQREAQKVISGEVDNKCEIDGQIINANKFILRNKDEKDEMITFGDLCENEFDMTTEEWYGHLGKPPSKGGVVEMSITEWGASRGLGSLVMEDIGFANVSDSIPDQQMDLSDFARILQDLCERMSVLEKQIKKMEGET